MTPGIIALLLVLAVALLFVRVRTKRSTLHEGSVTAELGIPMTEEEIALERHFDEETMKLLEASILGSGFFRLEKIPALMASLRDGAVPFGRTNTRIAFEGDTVLTVPEKRALGLNTRMKYSRTFIECFEPAALKSIEPKATLECMHLAAFHRVSRKKELLRFNGLGFIRKVKVIPLGQCRQIKLAKKIYSLAEVPELPLPGCDAPFCMCDYEPIIPTEI
jgi:hypothetical protein